MYEKAEKQKLRKLLKIENHKHSKNELGAYSEEIMQRIEAHLFFKQAQVVLLFYALQDEPDTRSLIKKWCQHKRILLPVVSGPTSMELRVVNPSDPLVKGDFNIYIPNGKAFTDYSNIDLAIIPGVAFDRNGHRLGHGCGYYDRFFASGKFNKLYKIGICFPHQLIHQIPVEPNDVQMNEIITANPNTIIFKQ